MQAGSCDDTLYRIFKNDREVFNKGQEKIKAFVCKHATWEVQKQYIAIQIMAEAMTDLNEGIVEAAKFAASHWKMSMYNTLVWSSLWKAAQHVEMQHQFCTSQLKCFVCG